MRIWRPFAKVENLAPDLAKSAGVAPKPKTAGRGQTRRARVGGVAPVGPRLEPPQVARWDAFPPHIWRRAAAKSAMRKTGVFGRSPRADAGCPGAGAWRPVAYGPYAAPGRVGGAVASPGRAAACPQNGLGRGARSRRRAAQRVLVHPHSAAAREFRSQASTLILFRAATHASQL